MKADRRLYLTRDRETIVEDGDARAGSLLAAPGCDIPEEEVKRLGLLTDSDGRVTQPTAAPETPEVKEQPKPEDKQQKKPADKAVKKPTTKRRRKRAT